MAIQWKRCKPLESMTEQLEKLTHLSCLHPCNENCHNRRTTVLSSLCEHLWHYKSTWTLGPCVCIPHNIKRVYYKPEAYKCKSPLVHVHFHCVWWKWRDGATSSFFGLLRGRCYVGVSLTQLKLWRLRYQWVHLDAEYVFFVFSATSYPRGLAKTISSTKLYAFTQYDEKTFLKVYCEKHQRNSWKFREGSSSHTC